VEVGRVKTGVCGTGTIRMRCAAGSGGTVDSLFLIYHLWTIIEAFIEFVTILFLFFFLMFFEVFNFFGFFGCKAYGS